MAHQSGRKGKDERAELHGVYLVTWQTSWILNRPRHLICGNKLQYKKVILKDCGLFCAHSLFDFGTVRTQIEWGHVYYPGDVKCAPLT
jgi:hypothetical protein